MGFFKSLMSVISTDGKTGTPFKLDKNHTVYYKGKGVTNEDAAHVGGYYRGYGLFTDTNQSDIQIFSQNANDPIQVGHIIAGKSVSPESETVYKDAASGLQELFPGRVITVCLMDTSLNILKKL